MEIYCPGCNGLYEEKDRAKHRGCAINGQSQRLTRAINKSQPAINAVKAHAEVGKAVESASVTRSDRTANRRDRKAYNEYMRAYMREDRKKRRLARG
jgi:hypothetical protein